MNKKVIISVIGILLVIGVLYLARPYIGMLYFQIMVGTSDNKEEKQTKQEVEDYLKQKYQIEFDVEVEVNSLGLGTTITAYPKDKSSYSFTVDKDLDGTYVDHFLKTMYEKEIELALKDYSKLKNSPNIKVHLDEKALIEKKFDFSQGLPKLSTIPATPTIVVTDAQVAEDIDREEALQTLRQVIEFIQKEDISLKQLKATISVDAKDNYYYYDYQIPIEAFPNLTTVKELQTYEKVKVVKTQED
ncbi:hypothetical protein [Ornithinibacillus scapharcae]|uniref:hypothetical protein n=1 Tax=Ornithinibacillus scapharcae TaxID=1147159 RepID=UPI000225B9D4|nr:hypothetical protein [Ornithinibacillus scapharcae]